MILETIYASPAIISTSNSPPAVIADSLAIAENLHEQLQSSLYSQGKVKRLYQWACEGALEQPSSHSDLIQILCP